MNNTLKPIAFYLPQFHPIPENDEWWGKGFTEWTNVANARPLFEGHWQPRLPADLGFYDLRVNETRIAQADLAKQYGVYGFCYWHYWFGGKQILERPLQEVVSSGHPDFPFCMAWANQTWQGNWHGLSNNKILVEQTYPGNKDHEAHFYTVLPALKDPRYITVNEKKLFMVFQPLDLPDSKAFIDCWQNLATREGIGGIYFVAMHMPYEWDHTAFGFDAVVQGISPWVDYLRPVILKKNFLKRQLSRFWVSKKELMKKPRKVSYKKMTDNYPESPLTLHQYPLVYLDWDNTPRSGADGWLFDDFSFQLFEEQCTKAFHETVNKPAEEKLVFIKSWNEWAEGNYMEPDQRHGHSYLKAFKNAVNSFNAQLK